MDYLHITHKHTPGKKNRVTLTVQGMGVAEISDELKLYSKNSFPDFDIECEDTGYLYHDQFWGKRCGDIQVVKDVVDTEDRRWVPVKKASCGLILAGRAKNKANEQTVLYAVFSAHLVLDDSQCKELLRTNPVMRMEDMDDKIKTTAAKYYLQTHNSGTKIDLIEYPMITYGHYFTMDDHMTEVEEKKGVKRGPKWEPHKRFMKDVAIARLSDGNKGQEFFDKLCDTMSTKELYSGHKSKRYKVAEVLPVRDPLKLYQLHQRRINIKIGPVNGHLYRVGDTKWREQMRPDKRQRSHTIEFTTKNQ